MPIDGAPLDRWIDPRRVLASVALDRSEPALLSPSEPSVSSRSIDRASQELATFYRELGLAPGDRLASVLSNRVILASHYLACFKAGIVATPLSPRLGQLLIERALQLSGARGVIADAQTIVRLKRCRGGAEFDIGVIAVEDTRTPASTSGSAPPDPAESGLPADANALLLFTSGSTGPAKGVMHTIASLGYRIATTSQALALTGRDVYLPTSSLADGMTINATFAMLAMGGQVVIPPESKNADELLALLRSYRPTVMGLVPSTLYELLNHSSVAAEDFASLRLVRCSGDRLSSRLEERFRRVAGFPITRGYGLTEIGPVTLNHDPGLRHVGSVGQPGPGIQLEVRDAYGQEVCTRSRGTIWVRSPSRTIGYWQRPTVTARVIKDGWFDTGDSGYVDEDGYLWLTGRQAGIIIRDGRNIHPAEVEDVLAQHPAVDLVAVVGTPSFAHGENVCAYVTFGSPGEPTIHDLLAWAAERLGVAAPTEVVELEAMPLKPSGKIDRDALRAMSVDEGSSDT